MLRLRSTRIVTPAGVVSGEVCVRDGLIETIGPPTDADAIELGSHWIVPGFIDLHVHGGGGAQCNTSDPDEVRAVARFHVEHGTTSLLATTVAAPVDDLVEALGAIRGAAGALGTVGTVATVARPPRPSGPPRAQPSSGPISRARFSTRAALAL